MIRERVKRQNSTIYSFCHIEKTGGTTLLECLRTNLPTRHCDLIPKDQTADLASAADLQRAESAYPRLVSIAAHSIRPYVDFGIYKDRLTWYTILRSPVARYISDYQHDVHRRGYSGSLDDWLEFEDRWNFQTQALAGEPDLDKAKEILHERFAVVGTLAGFDEFVDLVRLLMVPFQLRGPMEIANQAGPTSRTRLDKNPDRNGRAELDVSDRTMKSIREKNQLDIELYSYVESTLAPSKRQTLIDRLGDPAANLPDYGRREAKARRYIALAYRNLWYKPLVGVRPFRLHALPRNAVNSAEYYASQGDRLNTRL